MDGNGNRFSLVFDHFNQGNRFSDKLPYIGRSKESYWKSGYKRLPVTRLFLWFWIVARINPMEIDNAQENKREITLFRLNPPPQERRCQAKSKQSGKQCKNWALKNKRLCRFHGGRSTGPKTAQGIENIRQTHLKTGKYTLDKLRAEMLNRIGKVLFEQRTQSWVYKYIQQKMDDMNCSKFDNAKPKLIAFCRGQISMKELAAFLDGRKTKDINEQEENDI